MAVYRSSFCDRLVSAAFDKEKPMFPLFRSWQLRCHLGLPTSTDQGKAETQNPKQGTRGPSFLSAFLDLHSGAAVSGPLAGAGRGGAGVHLFVALALELLVEDAGFREAGRSALPLQEHARSKRQGEHLLSTS